MNSWKESQLGEEVELAYGKSLPAHARQAGNFEVYGSNGRVGRHSSPLVAGPGIVVGRKGSVGKVVYSDQDFWPIDTTYYVVNKNDHNWRFLYHLLSFVGLDELNSHSAIPGLNRQIAYLIPISLPEKSEQAQVACVLDVLERAVRREGLAIELSQELKRAAMQTLFTRGLRGEPQKQTEIGPVPESWEIENVGTIREVLQYGTSTRCSYEPTEFPVLRIPNIEPGQVNTDDLKFGGLRKTEADRYRLDEGDLIFIRTNGVIERLGACAVYQGKPKNALFASYLIRVRLNADRADPKFVASFFGSELGVRLVADRATPAADGKYNLNTGTIDGLPLPLPATMDEQREIVAILDTIDRKIDLHRRKRATLQDLFKSLLHKLMTGEICVGELDLSVLADK